MKILVTGGAGFIGSNVVDMLISRGHKVVVVDNLSTGRRENVNPCAEFYEADIKDKEELNNVFKKENPDAVCHHAAQINVRKSIANPAFDAHNNVIGTINVLECCKDNEVKKIVYASSGGARYGEPVTLPCSENHRVRPLSPYGISKHSAEHYVELYYDLYGLDYTILAYANVYGPRQDPKGEAGVIALFLDWCMKGKVCDIFGDGKQTRDYVYVGDVARANVLALERETKSKNFNIGTGVETSVNKLFETISEIVGKGDKKHSSAVEGEVRKIYLDCGLAEKGLGWKAEVGLKEGLEKTFEWLKKKNDR